MKYITGIVKKYTREYTRTLKNNEKRKYKTEQVQITIPKQNDIFSDKEEVLIIPKKYKEKAENAFDIINILELHNYIERDSNEKLKIIIEEKDSTISKFKEKIDTIEKKNNDSEKENMEIKNHKVEKINNYANIIEVAKLKEDKKTLKKEIINLEANIRNLKMENTKFINIEKKYHDLINKYEYIQLEFDKTKKNENYYEKLVKKLKEFIINSY